VRTRKPSLMHRVWGRYQLMGVALGAHSRHVVTDYMCTSSQLGDVGDCTRLNAAEHGLVARPETCCTRVQSGWYTSTLCLLYMLTYTPKVSTPNTWQMVSDDYGESWSDPSKLFLPPAERSLTHACMHTVSLDSFLGPAAVADVGPGVGIRLR
jgi:hypothetical protein